MKNAIKIFFILLITGAIGAFIYWQNNKKQIVKNSIDKALTKKTDSLYFLRYDSSVIDEVNGDVAFYNVVLQSDSAQTGFDDVAIEDHFKLIFVVSTHLIFPILG